MKKYSYITFLHFILFVRLNTFCTTPVPDFKSKTLEFVIDDSLKYTVEIVQKHSVISIKSYKLIDSTFVRDGYQYYFDAKGRLETLSLYKFGDSTGFRLKLGKNKIDSLFTMQEQNILDVCNSISKSGASSTHPRYFYTSDLYSSYKYNCDISDSEIVQIKEQGMVLSCDYNGVLIAFEDGQVLQVLNYVCDKQYGIALYFKRKHIYMIQFIEGSKDYAYKAKDLIK